MTDSNIQPPSDPNAHVHADGTTAVPNPIPGIEVTQTPGLIPETTVPTPVTGGVTGSAITEGRPDLGPDTTYTENDGSSGNIAPPPLNIPNVVLPPSVTGTEWDGTIAPPPYTTGQSDITEVPPTDYASAVDHLVDTMRPADMPVADASEEAHSQMMADPVYAIATHENQLNKIANMLEELCSRVISIEAKIMQHEAEHHGPDLNNPINDYPEIQHHQHGSQHYGGSPGLTV